MMNKLLFLFMSFILSVGKADLLVEPEKALLSKGYTPVRAHQIDQQLPISTNAMISMTPTDLIWPVNLLGDYKNSIGLVWLKFKITGPTRNTFMVGAI